MNKIRAAVVMFAVTCPLWLPSVADAARYWGRPL